MILPRIVAFAARADQRRFPSVSMEARVKLNGTQAF
jgi:hypothetical protein